MRTSYKIGKQLTVACNTQKQRDIKKTFNIYLAKSGDFGSATEAIWFILEDYLKKKGMKLIKDEGE